jgi:hypothetical protein
MSKPQPLQKENSMSVPLAPTFTPTPDAGEAYASFANSVSVAIASSGAGTIYYTTDETDPRTHGKVYSTPLVLNASTPVNAVGISASGIGPVAKQDFVLQGS